MSLRLFFIQCIILMSTYLMAQFPIVINEIELQSNGTTIYEGDLEDGRKMTNLDWASKSTVACFPATQNEKFDGNHVLHGFVMPAYSEVIITVEPNNHRADFSIYGYQVGRNNYPVVPQLNTCTSCEADYKWDRPKSGQQQDYRRSIRFNAFQNSYNVILGVSAANGLTKCAYTVKIKLISKDKNALPQEKMKIYSAPSEANNTKIYLGDLKDGVQVQDLSWASSSSVACFPATQNTKFNGNHILYVSEIPAYSEMEITVIPEDENANMSIYAYQTGLQNTSMVPELSRCVSCEAEHKWDYPKRGRSQDHTRTVRLNAIKNPYRIVVGVAGAERLAKGKFKLKIKTVSRVQSNEEQEKLKVYRAGAVPNETKSYKGSLEDGVKVHDLSWASRSSTACFPATQNAKFTGNHIIYLTEIPAYSNMDITVVPSDKNANMSIYAYMTNPNSDVMVPNLSSCVSCEAEHKWDYPKRGKTQDHTRSIQLSSVKNPYRVVVGVAGANGLTSGDFIIKINTKSKGNISSLPQDKLKIYRADALKGVTKSYKGSLADGVKVHDLSWASRSSTACFPATQNAKFTGNHVLYVAEIPSRSSMEVTVVPSDKNANMSIYAYMDAKNSSAFPPSLSSCVSCEAEHKWDYPKRGKTQDHTRTIRLNAVNNPYRVVIGVAGAEGLDSGDFILKIKTE